MTDEMRAREIVNAWLPQPVTAKAATSLAEAIAAALSSARAEERRRIAREIRDALQFDLVLDERGMRVTYDAYDNLDGARIDVGDTHVSHAYAETVDRVCDQLHAAREIVRRVLSDGASQ